MRENIYLPEGCGPRFSTDLSLSSLREAMDQRTILRGIASRCNGRRSLQVQLGNYEGIIPRTECVHPSISGSERDIAILSLVGKEICFTITDIQIEETGQVKLILSRRAAQEQALSWLKERAIPGTVLPCRITHLAEFGAFVDIGCGIISMIPLERLSIARVKHPSDRFRIGQDILALVLDTDLENSRFFLSHKELLGTWEENAAAFSPGDTVTGVVRDIRDYGAFIELAPNLTGLVDPQPDLKAGTMVSVYIKSIRPETRKIKLHFIQDLGPAPAPAPVPPTYYITEGPLKHWVY